MDFGLALHKLNQGSKVAREGWNGKGMFLVLNNAEGQMFADLPVGPHILMKTVQNTYVPWLASQTDVLATDWQTL